jgi:hypothetical protein
MTLRTGQGLHRSEPPLDRGSRPSGANLGRLLLGYEPTGTKEGPGSPPAQPLGDPRQRGPHMCVRALHKDNPKEPATGGTISIVAAKV